MKVNHAWFAVAGAAAAGAVAGLANSGLLHKAAVAVTTAGIKVTDAVAAETQSIVDEADNAALFGLANAAVAARLAALEGDIRAEVTAEVDAEGAEA